MIAVHSQKTEPHLGLKIGQMIENIKAEKQRFVLYIRTVSMKTSLLFTLYSVKIKFYPGGFSLSEVDPPKYDDSNVK